MGLYSFHINEFLRELLDCFELIILPLVGRDAGWREDEVGRQELYPIQGA